MLFYITEFYNLLWTICFRVYHYILIPLRYKLQVVGLKTMAEKKTDPMAGFFFYPIIPNI